MNKNVTVDNMTSSEEVWDRVVMGIPPPPENKRVWKVKDAAKRLSVAIVEPRSHRWLKGVLHNMAHIYGGTDVALFIFHGTDNLPLIQNIIAGWQNVNLIPLNVANLTISDYSRLLFTKSFYENFISSEHVLIFQTDSLIRKPIDDIFFQYNWCGAPWTHPGCGNGGFSLRRVRKMIDLSLHRTSSYYVLPEDLFFNLRLKVNIDYPPRELAMKFSCETVYSPDPCGLHATYKYVLQPDLIVGLLTNI